MVDPSNPCLRLVSTIVRKGRVWLSALLICLVGGCHRASQGEHPPASLVIVMSSSPEDSRYKGRELELERSVGQGLIAYVEGTLTPALAQEYEIDSTQRIYLFTLRQSLIWSDGVPFDPQELIDTWAQYLREHHEQAHLFFPIRNAQAIYQGKLPPEALGVKKISAHQVSIELEYPHPDFLHLLTHPLFYPQAHHPLSKVNSAPSLGPFYLAQTQDPGRYLLLKNLYYWNRHEVVADSIEIRVVSKTKEAWRLFSTGKAHLLDPLHTQSLIAQGQSLPKDSILVAASRPAQLTISCQLNTQVIPLNRQKIRKGLCLIVPRELISRRLHLFNLDTAFSPLPTPLSMLNRTWEEGMLATAQNLFTAGIDEQRLTWKELPPFHLLFKDHPLYQSIAEELKKVWEEELGIHVILKPLAPNEYLQKIQKMDYELALIEERPSFNSPLSLLILYAFPPYHHTGWQRASFQALIEEANATPVASHYQDCLAAAERQLWDGSSNIGLFNYRENWLQCATLKGVKFFPNGSLNIESISNLKCPQS